jgi:fucose permease
MKRLSNLFRTADGKNYAVTFTLVCTLFLLWGLCNGMIDVLNKHFQNSLHVTKAQSAIVQFAHYMGYFLMAIPSGLLARRYGYKGGILIGLGLIAAGAFLFIPATMINTFWAFLASLFVLATGLTCLETIANPYTTVLGSPETGATRINLAQSNNGIGWMIGPMLGGFFVLSSTAEVNTSNAALYKPYLLIGIVVTVLFILFAFANVPDLNAAEESKSTSKANGGSTGKPLFKRWHFTLAIAAQFFYVAAQTGIFSFFINYIVTEVPVLSQSFASKLPSKVPTYPAAVVVSGDFTDIQGFIAKLQNDSDPRSRAVSQFLWTEATNTQVVLKSPDADPKTFKKEEGTALEKDLNRILQTNTLYSAERFPAANLSEQTRAMLAAKPEGEALVRLNRRLLEDTYSEKDLARSSYVATAGFRISELGASFLLSFGGFALFLIGRFTGSAILGVCKAHTTLALYALINAIMMVLIILPLGWISVTALFLSFFFMSIMFPTIFALGIRGLGEHTKIGSSLIVMAIVGGAIMPMFMGWLADVVSMRFGFLMPMICFVVIFLYGAFWKMLEDKDTADKVETPAIPAH